MRSPQAKSDHPMLDGWHKDLARSRRAPMDYGWERLYEGQGADEKRRPAYGWERPGPQWQRGYGAGRPFYGWGRPDQWDQRAEYYRGMYAGYGPRNYRRPDHFLYEDVCEALAHDAQVDASEVEVSVNEGVVVLRGTIDSRAMKYAAEDVVLTVPGVKDVENHLKVTNPRVRR